MDGLCRNLVGRMKRGTGLSRRPSTTCSLTACFCSRIPDSWLQLSSWYIDGEVHVCLGIQALDRGEYLGISEADISFHAKPNKSISINIYGSHDVIHNRVFCRRHLTEPVGGKASLRLTDPTGPSFPRQSIHPTCLGFPDVRGRKMASAGNIGEPK